MIDIYTKCDQIYKVEPRHLHVSKYVNMQRNMLTNMAWISIIEKKLDFKVVRYSVLGVNGLNHEVSPVK